MLTHYEIDKNKICTCECHQHGVNLMHFIPCCEYTYKKYIDINGIIDYIDYEEIVEAARRRRIK